MSPAHGQVNGRGQATVELALLLPVIMAIALAVVQVGIVSFRQVQVVHAAREVGRMVAVTGDETGVTEAAAQASALDVSRLEVLIDGPLVPGSLVTVTVRYRDPTEVPVIGSAISDVVLQAQITMRVE